MPIQGLYKCFNHWHAEGTTWLYSDPHFNDPDILAGVKNPMSADDQIKMINSKVGRKDTFICLGDICDVSYVKKIRAQYKILIMGNHDSGRSNYEHQIYKELFSMDDYTKEEALSAMKEKYPDCRYTIGESYGFHSPFTAWVVSADNMLFDEVYEGPLMIAEKLILSHEPIDVPWAYNIHGHDHAGWNKRKNSLNVCANIINYTPINFNQWMKGGHLSHIETLHRSTIDTATERKRKRGGKKLGKK